MRGGRVSNRQTLLPDSRAQAPAALDAGVSERDILFLRQPALPNDAHDFVMTFEPEAAQSKNRYKFRVEC